MAKSIDPEMLTAPRGVAEAPPEPKASGSEAEQLDGKFDRFAAKLPAWAARALRWLRHPSSRWVRIPAALVLIIGGFAGFLPVLGFWMVPLGALLLAQDVPFLQKPLLRALVWVERKWDAWKRRRRR